MIHVRELPREPKPGERRRRLRHRAYTVTVRGDEAGHYEGFGVTLESVIRFELVHLAHGIAVDTAQRPDLDERRRLAGLGDHVIWRGNRVVALLLVRPGGPYVVRLDGKADISPGGLVEVGTA